MLALPTGTRLREESELIEVLLSALLLAFQDGRGVVHAPGFAAGMEEASRRQVPLIVFVHGSDWNRLGERLNTGMWQAPGTWTMLKAIKPQLDLVVTDIDTLQSPTTDQTEVFQSLHAGWKKQGLVTYPALIAFAADGTVLGSRQGELMPRTSEDVRETFFELARSAHRSNELRAEIEAAKSRGDSPAEAEAIHRMFDLPLERPTGLLERLESIDPADTSGLRRRESLPPWHTLIAQATKDASNGNSAEALARLEALLADEAYSDSQRAWLNVAIGGVYRKTEGHDSEAAAAFQEAWSLDPGGIAGNTGMRWYLRFHSDPSLLFGWMPRHCSPELTTWTVEDLPDRLEPGSYSVTFMHSKGRQGLAIEGVELIVGGDDDVVARDDHPGLSGKEHRDNVYTLRITEAVDMPRLRIRCRSNGGTDSHGTLTLEGPLENAG